MTCLYSRAFAVRARAAAFHLLMNMPAFLHRGRLAILMLPLLVGCRSGSFPEYPASYREYVYVANTGSDTVSVLDLVHVRPQATLTVGPHPSALLANPAVNEVYAAVSGANGGRGSLAVIDAEQNRVMARLPLGVEPSAIATDGGGKRLYVANSGSNNLSVVDVRERKVLGVGGVGEQPEALALAHDGSVLAVANRGSGSVSLLDLSDGLPRVRASFDGCPGAGSPVILPDASKVFVACAAGRQVMVVGLRAASGSHSVPGAEKDRLLTTLDVGQRPVHLELKPDGGEIFVANAGSDTVSEIATAANEVGGASLIGANPTFALVSQDNALLWVANERADTVAVYSIDDGKLINTVHTGDGPGDMAFSADGHLLLTADRRSGDVSVIRTFSRDLHRRAVYGTLFTLLSAGKSPGAIVDKAFNVQH